MSERPPLSFDINKGANPQSLVQETSLRASEQTEKRTNTKTQKQENVETKNSREGRQFIAAHVLPEAAKQFKLLVVQNDTTTQEMLVEAINDLFAKYGLSRIA
jgi:hypothetical protein